MRTAVAFAFAILFGCLTASAETPENEVRAVLTAYADGMRDRNVSHVQKTVGSDLVVLAGGYRADGWEQYRDRHLVPEFSRPAVAAKWELVRLNATADMAWAYSKTVVSSKQQGESVIWTVFALERRGKEWKIVLVARTGGHAPGAPLQRPRRR